MLNREIIAKTTEYVRSVLSGDSSGHDWWHIWRVRNLAMHIGRAENADLEVVQLAALLHDIADWKFHNGDLTAGARAAREWLSSFDLEPQIIQHVEDIMAGLSFKGAGVADDLRTLEGQVVQDADRLDAMGAIGVARAFAYGGHAGQPLYDPDIPPERHDSFEAYRTKSGPTLNHFDEKLLLLLDRMHTPTARRLAEVRHKFMEQFLVQFHEEWTFAAAK